METAAKELDFVEAARLRDRMKSFQDHLKNWFFPKIITFIFSQIILSEYLNHNNSYSNEPPKSPNTPKRSLRPTRNP
jgi:hypothetical protein